MVGFIFMAMVFALVAYATNEPTVWIPAIIVAMMALIVGTMKADD